MNFLYLSFPVLFLFVSTFLAIRAVKRGRKKRNALAAQLLSFLAVCLITFAVPAVAANAASNTNAATAAATTEEAAPAADSSMGFTMLAAALSTGLAAIGGGIAVAASAPAAIGATSEDPKAFGKALIFVALGEGIAIYGLLMSILILNKV
ncbi:MAG: ATP synthase subunit C [Oscillospiraceae bacterium]|jgi:V/A-type H+-transporting ATPase subunit K|nr:ATP synthase subunit C [Oscillospiraceae bacterium]